MKNENREPLLRVYKRESISRGKTVFIRLASIFIALIVCAGVIYALSHSNPIQAYATMIKGAFGSTRKSWETLRDAMLLLCISVGLAPAFKMRFWNIGAEGQVLVGGIVSAACMIYWGNSISTPLLLIIMIAASCAAGAVWGLIPAIFKARWNTNETLFTLMMNYIAIQLTSYFVTFWENPKNSNSVGIINLGTKGGWFPALFGQQYLLNVVIVLAITAGVYIYMRYTKHGYELSVVGESINTAKYAGIKVRKVIRRTMALSGAICGVAGFIAVSGASHTISTSTAGGRGFTAIIVAWLAKFNPYVMILYSLLLAFLDKGAMAIASKSNGVLNDYVSSMITGIILFFILGSEFFIEYKVELRRHTAVKEAEAND